MEGKFTANHYGQNMEDRKCEIVFEIHDLGSPSICNPRKRMKAQELMMGIRAFNFLFIKRVPGECQLCKGKNISFYRIANISSKAYLNGSDLYLDLRLPVWDA